WLSTIGERRNRPPLAHRVASSQILRASREGGFVDSTRAWLSTLHLSQYTEAFDHNDVAWDLLRTLTDQDLRELGVQALGHRKTLLKAIAELNAAGAPTLLPPADA